MALPHNLQTYLERHKIGALFEELMGKVIGDMPGDPYAYLIHALEKKAQRQTGRRSQDRALTEFDRQYDRPWVVGNKTVKPKASDRPPSPSIKTGKPKGEWKSQTVKPGSTFDALWGSSDDTPTKTSKTISGTSKSVSSGHLHSVDQEFLYASNGYEGPKPRRSSQPMDWELPLASSKKTIINKDTQARAATVSLKAKKRGNPALASQNNMLNQRNIGRNEALMKLEDDHRKSDEDEGVELLENMDDLRNEGVKKVTTTSNPKAVRSYSSHFLTKPSVTVSICARCARALSDETERASSDVNRPESRQSAVRFSPSAESDEEFESVSQVTGPRQPVWQEDSDSEEVTPRKGQHMFENMTSKSVAFPMSNQSRQKANGAVNSQRKVHHSLDLKTDVQSPNDEDFLLAGDRGSPWAIPPTERGTEVSSMYRNDRPDLTRPY